jgi:catechol 2,3-dioxygenase-like lactoylglutathione lyase family enzyme
MGSGLTLEKSFMTIQKIYAHVSCSDLERSVCWFEKLFGRPPDARQMAGLVEWHHGTGAGLQVWLDAANAGRGTLTLIVTGLREEHARLVGAGLEPGEVEPGDKVSLFRVRDPDQNLVVLAQAGRPS